MRRRTKILIGLGVFVFAIVAARLVAPIYILGYVNKTLQGLDGYTGRVADIDLGIWRGAYVIRGITIEKTTEKLPVPFVSIDQVDVALHWDALLKGAIVAEIDLQAPKLNIVAEKHKEPTAEQKREEREKEKAMAGQSSWQTQVKELVPLDINRIGIQRGELRFRDPYADPKVDVAITDLHGAVTNLTNSEDLNEDMVARANFKAKALNSGNLSLDGTMDPYTKLPTFDLKAKLEDLELTELNDFLKAYVNVDAEKGTLSVYTDVTSKNGRFKGYVKPMTRNLQILAWKDEEEGFFKKVWEGVVEFGKDIFENDDKDQVATRIPLSGKVDNVNPDILATVGSILRNAFIEALRRGLDPTAMGDGEVARSGD